VVNADDKARVPNSKNKRTSNQKTKERITQIEVNISVEFLFISSSMFHLFIIAKIDVGERIERLARNK